MKTHKRGYMILLIMWCVVAAVVIAVNFSLGNTYEAISYALGIIAGFAITSLGREAFRD